MSERKGKDRHQRCQNERVKYRHQRYQKERVKIDFKDVRKKG